MARAKKGLVELDPSQIDVGDRRRKDYGDIENLMESIREKGQIQPITIGEDYKLAAGGRRLEAIRRLGDRKVICLVRHIEDELDLREVELFENIHREDMTWQEEVRAVKNIHELMQEKYGGDWSQRRTAKLLGKSQGMISENIQLAEAMEFIPELEKNVKATDARKQLNRMVNDVSVKRRVEKAKAAPDYAKYSHRFAEDHYKVGDAIEGMKSVNDCICNFAEVDPPYAIELDEKRRDKNDGRDVSMGIDSYNEISRDKYQDFLYATAKEVFRILDDHSFCVWWFGPTWDREVRNTLLDVGFKVDDIPAIWYKMGTSAATNAPNIYLPRSYEPFYCCRKGNPQLIKKGHSNVFPFEGIPHSQRIHATERPLPLMQDIIETFTIPSARILVPFLGSGNTLLAAYKTDRIGFGWDMSEEHKNRFMGRVLEMFPDKKDVS